LGVTGGKNVEKHWHNLTVCKLIILS